MSKIVKLGTVEVDSGQLMICDPCYIESEFKNPDSGGKADHGHAIYKHKDDGKLWQFCYNEQPGNNAVNAFPGSYMDMIPEYGKCPNDLIQQKIFEKTDIDPVPHIPASEFSYRSICKTTGCENQGGQLNYTLGHEGVAVAFRSGLGDGTYDVYAEIVEAGNWGERIKKVWVELITDEQLRDMKNEMLSELN